MADYGFTLKVDDLTSAKMKQIEAAMKSMGATVKTESKGIQDSFNGLEESARSLATRLAEAFAVREVIRFGQELLHTAAEFQGFENVIKYSSVSTVDAAQNMEYITEAVDRLHLPMKEAIESFSEMQAGFYGTGIEGDRLRKVFEGVAEASSVLHLNPATFSRVTFALKEIGELGTLQARQLRMLSFAMPGAGHIAAASMGMTSEQLHEGMKKGEIKSSDFLPKFAEALSEHYHKGLKNAGNSLISQINDEKNSIVKLMVDMGEKLTPFFSHILKSISDGIYTIKAIWDSITANSSFVDGLKFIFDWTVKLVPIWAGYRLIMAGWNGILMLSTTLEGLFTRELIANTVATAANGTAMAAGSIQVAGFGATLVTTTVEAEAATGAMVGLQTVLTTFAVGGIIIGLGLLVEKLIALNRESREAADTATEISKTGNIHKESSKIYRDISDRFADYGNKSGNKEDKSVLLKDAIEAQRFLQDKQTKEFSPAMAASVRANEAANKILGWTQQTVGASSGGIAQTMKVPVYAEDQVFRNQAKKSLEQQVNDQKFLTAQIKNLGWYIQQLTGQGIKPAKAQYTGPGGEGGSLKDSAMNTSQLAGAAGGLGQAKIINIHIDTVQKNIGVNESKSHADDAVEQLIREINNMSDSQNSM